jgi:hypothetical protein
VDRFAAEAPLLVDTRSHPSYYQALRRSRVVADDWLVSIDANRYSVPWRLIGKTVTVVRVGECWQISHLGKLVAEHAILIGKHHLSVDPAHGPGAVARNVRSRFASSSSAPTPATPLHDIEVRDLAVYEQLLEVA